MEIIILLKSHRLYYAGLCLVALIWGANFGISRWAMELFPPEIFVFIRFGLALPILFLILRWSEGSIKVARRDLIMLASIGLLGVTVLEIIVMYSIKFTTLANASLLNVAPWPIFVALLAPLFTREILTTRIVIGGIFALIGVVFIILGGGSSLDLSSKYMLGNMLALLISLLGALFNLFCMPLMRKYSALRVTTWYIFFGSLFMFPTTWGNWGKVEWTSLPLMAWGAVAYNVLLCTVAAFVIWNLCMSRVGATKANFYRYLVPAAATLTGALFFAEAILPLQIVGGLVIVVGLLWISLEKIQKMNTSHTL